MILFLGFCFISDILNYKTYVLSAILVSVLVYLFISLISVGYCENGKCYSFHNTELMLVLLLVCFGEYHIFKADYQICLQIEECNEIYINNINTRILKYSKMDHKIYQAKI